MDFDGAMGKDGAGIGIWICNPTFQWRKFPSNVRICSYKLAFDCYNNEAEYEVLIVCLKILKKMNAKRISIYGDSELIIKQVKGEYQAKHLHMRAYRNEVLDILRMFPDYTLTAVPHAHNVIAYSLASTASNLKILMNSNKKFEIHFKHFPIVLDNLRYWQVFWDDKEINAFLQNEGSYKDASIDIYYDTDELKIKVNQMEILQLKDNIIPKGLIPLEELFDQDDVARKTSLVPIDKSVEDVNLGTTKKPEFVKLSKTLSPGVKSKYVRLISEFSDVFAWDYSNLKVYEKDIIHHTILIGF